MPLNEWARKKQALSDLLKICSSQLVQSHLLLNPELSSAPRSSSQSINSEGGPTPESCEFTKLQQFPTDPWARSAPRPRRASSSSVTTQPGQPPAESTKPRSTATPRKPRWRAARGGTARGTNGSEAQGDHRGHGTGADTHSLPAAALREATGWILAAMTNSVMAQNWFIPVC